ncbi:MAG: hypothetical protein KTR25_00625 [Myxococcales bacterium]|nr:hypothetical protein [Myxococcales bacterium]
MARRMVDKAMYSAQSSGELREPDAVGDVVCSEDGGDVRSGMKSEGRQTCTLRYDHHDGLDIVEQPHHEACVNQVSFILL